ncbi:MAG: capsule biosynthesis protein CapD [Flavobacteriaceae bacterium]|nr:capsule biosynthesis protein CapD [Flavobacteriaceae bacterium]
MNKKNILITGGTGSFGRQLVKEVSGLSPNNVVIYSRDEDKQYSMKQDLADEKISERISFVIGDIRDYERFYSASKNMDVIFHAAALKQVPTVELYPYEAVKTNILGTYNIVRAAVARKVKNVISISTDKAVKPVNAMGMTKALQEKIILSDDLQKDTTKFSCVRYGNVLGSRGSVIPLWDSKIKKNKPLPVTHPDMTRFMLTLGEAIHLVFYALKNAKGGEIFVKKAPATKIVDLAKVYAENITGKNDYPIEYVGRRAGEKIHEVLVSEEEMRNVKEMKDHYIIHRELDFDLASLKKERLAEYSSDTVSLLTKPDLKKIMKNLSWIP